MTSGYHVVDLFAGPGGLAEGFSEATCRSVPRPFSIALSVECDPAAHATLTLRTFLRQFEDGFPAEYYRFLNDDTDEPDWSALYPDQWQQATNEALQLRLGNKADEEVLDQHLDALAERCGDRIIVTGGPPCQAYSLVGRVRNAKVAGYSAEKDERYGLYKEYVRVVSRLKPAAFVMENVKGLLSARLGSEKVIDGILSRLHAPCDGTGYRLLCVALEDCQAKAELQARDYVVRSELHGVPQARHRIIVIGIRDDLASKVLSLDQTSLHLKPWFRASTVDDAIGGMPALRSGLSKGADTFDDWLRAVVGDDQSSVDDFLPHRHLDRRALTPNGFGKQCPEALKQWLLDPLLSVVPNHQTRGHIAGDLRRYRFAALFARQHGRSPKSGDFPATLAPGHANWATGDFSDRFRVQISGAPATTITSHIAKDGHYFIHPDPDQCRSLTVREAARLQTFPDNYYFKGNRTQQYTQVGNAVPPLLARQIGEALADVLFSPDASDSGEDSGATRSQAVRGQVIEEYA
jgi:DNA (cytosine-5)-methyltransferase 1